MIKAKAKSIDKEIRIGNNIIINNNKMPRKYDADNDGGAEALVPIKRNNPNKNSTVKTRQQQNIAAGHHKYQTNHQPHLYESEAVQMNDLDCSQPTFTGHTFDDSFDFLATTETCKADIIGDVKNQDHDGIKQSVEAAQEDMLNSITSATIEVMEDLERIADEKEQDNRNKSIGAAKSNSSTSWLTRIARDMERYPYTTRSVWSLIGVVLLLILGCILGAKASSVRTFWVVNVLSDALFSIALVMATKASFWLYEAILTVRINRGEETPVYITQGLKTWSVFKMGPRWIRTLGYTAACVTVAQLIADTGLDAESVAVFQGEGLVWMANDQCSAQDGINKMWDGPNGVFGSYARGKLKEDDMPLALLARDVYSGRVPDNGARVERVVSNPEQLSVVNTGYYTESGKPILDMPQAIPVSKTEELLLWPAFGRERRYYKGPAYGPQLEQVVFDPPTAKQLWFVLLFIENPGGLMLQRIVDSFDDDEWKEHHSEGEDGYFTHQFKSILVRDSTVDTLFVVHEKFDPYLELDIGLAAQLGDFNVPPFLWVNHLVTARTTWDCPDPISNSCSLVQKSIIGIWSFVTEGDLPLSALWPIWRSLPDPGAGTAGKGPTVIEDAARVVYASLYSCGEVGSGSVGAYEVRAVVSPQWFIAYIVLLLYVVACILISAFLNQNEPFVPIPKTWYDGYQMAYCDLGQRAGRDCADPFQPASATGKHDPLYNIEDNGPSKAFDHLGVTRGTVIARVRRLRGKEQWQELTPSSCKYDDHSCIFYTGF